MRFVTKKKKKTNKNVCRVRTCFIDNWKNNCAKNEVITELYIYLSEQHIKNSTKKIIKWMVRAKLCCDFGNAIQNYNKTKKFLHFLLTNKNKRTFRSKFNAAVQIFLYKNLISKTKN